jgi:hypothetical protein
MNLNVIRNKFDDVSTEGDFYIEDQLLCHSLELPWNNGENLHDKNCILPGRYQVTIDYSPHHKQLWFHILNVPGRDEIRIDIANRPDQILGCIAIGFTEGQDVILQSKAAWDKLFTLVQTALTKEQVWITIVNQM